MKNDIKNREIMSSIQIKIRVLQLGFYKANKLFYYFGFLSLFIKRNIATTKPTTTKAKTPIIMVPFVQETWGMFKKFILLNLR